MPSRAERMRLPSLAIDHPSLSDDIEAHGPGGTPDHGRGRIDRIAIHVDDLLLRDLADLRFGDLTDGAALARRLRAGRRLLAELEPGGALQEIRDRRLLHLEGEGAVLIGRDHDRDRGALLHLRGARVKRLAEFHDVETPLTERGANGRR